MELDKVAARTDTGVTFLSRKVLGEETGHPVLGEPNRRDVQEFDVLLLRIQPPFDLDYLATCSLLASLDQPALCVNSPASIIAFPEKIALLQYPSIHPPTIVTSDPDALAEFRAEHGDVVLKPLYDFQGRGVLRIQADDRNYSSLVETISRLYQAPLVMQKFIPAVRDGDKRIFLLGGEPIACFTRLAKPGKDISNLHAGGTPVSTELSQRDLEICHAIGPMLAGAGLNFVGIDVIGEYVTEIGTTSPTGIAQVLALSGQNVALDVWAWIEGQNQEKPYVPPASA